jgi:hypothetical protein
MFIDANDASSDWLRCQQRQAKNTETRCHDQTPGGLICRMAVRVDVAGVEFRFASLSLAIWSDISVVQESQKEWPLNVGKIANSDRIVGCRPPRAPVIPTPPDAKPGNRGKIHGRLHAVGDRDQTVSKAE